MVTRHRAMADGTKRTPRDLGAASPEQKPARPASEVVRDLLQRRGGAARTPSCSAREKGEGTQVPRCSKTQWRRGVCSLLRSCCGNFSTRAGSSCSLFFLQHPFRLGLATLAQRLVYCSLFSASGCGCHCATMFTTGSMPFWLADASKETTALSVLFSLQYLLRLFPRDALLRFTALFGHWPFAGDSEASGC